MDHEAFAEARRLVNGFQISEAVQVLVRLEIPELLSDGPRSAADLAEISGADAATLYRLLRTLAAAGVLEELPDRVFATTEVGAVLDGDAENSLRPWVLNVGRPAVRQAWAGLLDSVVTGRNAFTTVHGMSVWAYRGAHPDDGEVFDAAMVALSRAVAKAVISAYDFGRFSTVVDVGGGHGGLLAGILAVNPDQRGILFDQPAVVAGAGPVLAAQGVDRRCDLVPGDFFEAVPTAGDAYVLKSIIHDWDDSAAIAILTKVREALGPTAVVLVVERVVAGPNEGLDTKLSDLNMLVAPGGMERTESEFDALFEAAGLRRTRTVRTGSAFSVLEAQAG